MAGTVEYNDDNLYKLIEALSPKQRLAALKGALRAEARRVRKIAVSHLRSGANSNRDLEKGIRAAAFRRTAGFKVTIGSKKDKIKRGKKQSVWTGFGFHTNRRGKEKPVLIWLEGGTAGRSTRGYTRRRGGKRYRYGQKHRGSVKALRFMERTKAEAAPSVTQDLRNEIDKYIRKAAAKYGCKS